MQLHLVSSSVGAQSLCPTPRLRNPEPEAFAQKAAVVEWLVVQP